MVKPCVHRPTMNHSSVMFRWLGMAIFLSFLMNSPIYLSSARAKGTQQRRRQLQKIGQPKSAARGNVVTPNLDLNTSLHGSPFQDLPTLYIPCYTTLFQVSTDGESIGQEEYVDFLYLISDGNLNFPNFAHVPAIYLTLFYTAACTSTRDCVHEKPTIPLNRSDPEADQMLNFFCFNMLMYTYTQTTVVFSYSVRYNSAIVSMEQVTGCLQNATQDLLLDQLGGCWNVTVPDGRQLESTATAQTFLNATATVKTDNDDLFLSNDVIESNQRLYLPLDGCNYSADSVVTSIVDNAAACYPPPTNETTHCGLIGSTVTVATTKYIEPNASHLHDQVVAILRDAIDGGLFAQYLPPKCLLND